MPIVTRDYVRQVPGGVTDVMARIQGALAAQRFKLTAPGPTSLRGVRGSVMAMTKASMPISIEVTLVPGDNQTTMVHGRLSDRAVVSVAAPNVKRNYENLLIAVEGALDAALAGGTTPVATSSGVPPPPRQPGVGAPPPPPPPGQPGVAAVPPPPPPGQPGVAAVSPLPPPGQPGVAAVPPPPPPGQPGAAAVPPPLPVAQQGSAVPPATPSGAARQPAGSFDMAKLSESASAALAKASKATAAAVKRQRGAEPWQFVEEVWLGTEDQVAQLDAVAVQAELSVASMIERQPGSLPQNLADQLQEFSGKLTRSLNAAGAASMVRTQVAVEPVEKPIVEFMHQQARIRQALPVRTLHRCTACGFENVTNPDYKKLMERNRKLQALTGAVGLTFRGGAVSPFLLVGALFRLKKMDPDWVCRRCQGMESDVAIVTFCPDCGRLHREAVLRSCPGCSHDFRKALEPTDFWQPRPIGW